MDSGDAICAVKMSPSPMIVVFSPSISSRTMIKRRVDILSARFESFTENNVMPVFKLERIRLRQWGSLRVLRPR